MPTKRRPSTFERGKGRRLRWRKGKREKGWRKEEEKEKKRRQKDNGEKAKKEEREEFVIISRNMVICLLSTLGYENVST